MITSALEKHGIAAAFEFPPGSESRSAAERARQQVIDGKLDAIVVGGGDGSVRTVASVLAGCDIPLGILPLGTLNHFARDLGIPLVAERAVAIIAAGEHHAVDVGEVNDVTFVNNASIGFYPYLVLERERRQRRKRLSKWTALMLAMPRVLRNLPLFRLTVAVEGTVGPCRSPCALVGNNDVERPAETLKSVIARSPCDDAIQLFFRWWIASLALANDVEGWFAKRCKVHRHGRRRSSARGRCRAAHGSRRR